MGVWGTCGLSKRPSSSRRRARRRGGGAAAVAAQLKRRRSQSAPSSFLIPPTHTHNTPNSPTHQNTLNTSHTAHNAHECSLAFHHRTTAPQNAKHAPMEALREEIATLQRERAALEADIDARCRRLNAPGQPGLDGPLVDAEGYPRADVDVLAVRTDRNAVIRLTNDHKALTARLEQLLHRLHALARESGGGGASANGAVANGTSGGTGAQQQAGGGAPAAAAAAAPAAAAAAAAAGNARQPQPLSNGSGGIEQQQRPFAVVDEVSEASPAAEAGVQLGDQLVRFGDVTAAGGGGGTTGGGLAAVAAALQAAEGREVAVAVLRHGEPVALTLRPRQWGGRGLLGCHLRPLS